MMNGQIAERDAVQMVALLHKAQQRALRRLYDGGDGVFLTNEDAVGEAEDLEWKLAIITHAALHEYLNIQGEVGGPDRNA